MRVALSVLGRFHFFDHACELERRGALEHLFTSYPAGRARGFGVPAQKVSGWGAFEVINRATQKLPDWVSQHWDPRPWPCAWYEQHVARLLEQRAEGADLLHVFSGSALKPLKTAQRLGMVTVLERASTHIQHQDEVLSNEIDDNQSWLNCKVRRPHVSTIEKELAEYEQADFISVPSQFVRRTFLERGFAPERVLHLPYGASLKSFHPPVGANAEPVQNKKFRILQVGNVCLRKGAHRLLRVFQELNWSDAELWFMGPVAPEMRELLNADRSGRVFAPGSVPQSQLIEHYHQADVFCLASLEEGLAMVIPQAMACGVPVLATDASGAGDLVRDGREGLIVSSADDAALRAALLRLREDHELRRQMGASAALRASEGGDWSHYTTKALSLYERALEITNNPKSLLRTEEHPHGQLASAS